MRVRLRSLSQRGFTLLTILVGVMLTVLVSYLIYSVYERISVSAQSALAASAATDTDNVMLHYVESWLNERTNADSYNSVPPTLGPPTNYSLSCTANGSTLYISRSAVKALSSPSVLFVETLQIDTKCAPRADMLREADYGTICANCPMTCAANERPIVTMTYSSNEVPAPTTPRAFPRPSWFPQMGGDPYDANSPGPLRREVIGAALCYSPVPAIGAFANILTVEARSAYFGASIKSPTTRWVRKNKAIALNAISGGSTQYVHQYQE